MHVTLGCGSYMYIHEPSCTIVCEPAGGRQVEKLLSRSAEARMKICMAKFCATVVMCITLMGTSNKGMLFMGIIIIGTSSSTKDYLDSVRPS